MNAWRWTRMSLLLAVLVACVPAQTRGRGAFDSQLITQDEIVASRATNALEAVQKLRGNFLSNRGATSVRGTPSSYPSVYIDEQYLGSIGMLQTVPAAQIATIRLYRAWEATTRYGTNNMGGVIAITTRRGLDQSAALPDRQ